MIIAIGAMHGEMHTKKRPEDKIVFWTESKKRRPRPEKDEDEAADDPPPRRRAARGLTA